MSSPLQEWSRQLYIKQPYPDNYVPPNFLSQLQTNAHVKPLNFFQVMADAGVVSQQISTILLFVAIFVQVYQQKLDARLLLIFMSGTTWFALMIWNQLVTSSWKMNMTSQDSLRAILLLFLTLLGFTPILKTLTVNTSSDSIWALATFLLSLNFLLHDYSTDASQQIIFVDSMSINAGIFAAVVLASRLFTNIQVFALTCSAMQFFALFPVFRRALKRSSRQWDVALTIFLIVATFSTYLYLKLPEIAVIYLGVVFVVLAMCPALLIYLQRFKLQIRGPWDEGKPKLEKMTSVIH